MFTKNTRANQSLTFVELALLARRIVQLNSELFWPRKTKRYNERHTTERKVAFDRTSARNDCSSVLCVVVCTFSVCSNCAHRAQPSTARGQTQKGERIASAILAPNSSRARSASICRKNSISQRDVERYVSDAPRHSQIATKRSRPLVPSSPPLGPHTRRCARSAARASSAASDCCSARSTRLVIVVVEAVRRYVINYFFLKKKRKI